MGLIRPGEGELRGVVWIRKLTLRKCFEDVKLSRGLEVLYMGTTEVQPSCVFGLSGAPRESKVSDSGAGCWGSGCTHLAVDPVLIFF